MREFLAAPANFFSLPEASQIALASRSHLPRNDVSAAPASFFSAAAAVQVGPCANAEAGKMRAAKKGQLLDHENSRPER
jgi:hypothetical protein